MLAKILIGVVAAVAVAGVGIYYAYPHECSGTCPQTGKLEGSLPVSEGASCCAKSCPLDASTAAPAESCCAAAAQAKSDGLGACVGGMALTSAANAPATAKTLGCCDE